jgi:hypothetical protein
MLLAKPIQDALQLGAPAEPVGAKSRAMAGVAALLMAVARLALPAPGVEAVNAPVAALAAVPEALREKPVLNGYGFGGYLIFAHVRPFIDGRADMFGAQFMGQYRSIAAGEPAALEEALKRYDIAWTMFPPSQGVVAALDREPGWRRLYADAFAVVHVRDGALASKTELRGD